VASEKLTPLSSADSFLPKKKGKGKWQKIMQKGR